jgi:hypothetical protein
MMVLRNGRLWRLSNTHEEINADTHDLTLALPASQAPTLKRGQFETYRFILFSTSDADNAQSLERIKRLHRLEGGKNIAVIFWLGETGACLDGYAKMQAQ